MVGDCEHSDNLLIAKRRNADIALFIVSNYFRHMITIIPLINTHF